MTGIITSLFGGTNADGSGANGAGKGPPAAKDVPGPLPAREPAVAGLFYPDDPGQLSQTIDELLTKAPTQDVPNVKALVCPHAGYPYSGLTAAAAYKTVQGRSFGTVMVLAPSHYARFSGASVAATEAYRTPLGLVPVSAQARELAQRSPCVLEPRCQVQRPSWSFRASKPAPKPGEDTPDTWEHSLEVQVPFLQKVLKDFKLVPVVLGEVDPARLARVLSEFLDDRTLLIASSDLSHYHPYGEAKAMDDRCVKAICDMDVEALGKQEACGKGPILTLVHLARARGWKARLLDARNSGDTAGDKQSVVGYASVAFYAPEEKKAPVEEKKTATQPAPEAEQLNPQEKAFLLELARKTLESVVAKRGLPPVETSALGPHLTEPKGCFVTLKKKGNLRGCIGHIVPLEPLYKAVMDNASSSALRDYRFSPVERDEVSKIQIEISVLTLPQPLPFSSPEDLLGKLQPRRDGVVLQVGNRSATYLPQVWEQIPDKVTFLDQLALKAGAEAGAWRRPGASVQVYRVESFHEPPP